MTRERILNSVLFEGFGENICEVSMSFPLGTITDLIRLVRKCICREFQIRSPRPILVNTRAWGHLNGTQRGPLRESISKLFLIWG
jgi:hypothetical protein